MKSMRTSLLGAVLAVACLAMPLSESPGAPVTIHFDFSTHRSLGGDTTLQREKYFNIHANYNADDLSADDLDLLVNRLGVGFGRDFNSPFYFFQSKSTPYANQEQLQAVRARHMNTTRAHPLWQFRTSRCVITDHPAVAFSMDEDPEAAADWAADYFEHIYTEEIRPEFYEPLNEPFVHAHSFGKNEAQVRKQMALFFRAIGERFNQRALSTKVVGYASAWPSMELRDFEHWRTRMKMFMDTAGDVMDGFSIHLYDGTNVAGQDNRRSGSNAEAILDLIETYSMMKWGVVKPHAITEYGGIIKGYPEGYSDVKSSQELTALNHLLFTFLDRQDRIAITIPFITSKSAWFYNEENDWQPYAADLWRPDPDRIERGEVQAFIPTMKMLFYELWAGVQGNRAAAVSDDPDVRVQAFVDGHDAVLCLNNLDDEARAVTLHPVFPLTPVNRTWIKRLQAAAGKKAVYADEPLPQPPDGLTLAPHETVIVRYTFASPVAHAGTVESETHYSGSYLQPIEAGHTISFAFEDVATRRGRAFLRMGLGRKHDRSKVPVVTVNGHPVPVPATWPGYDQADREDFFGAIEIPVPIECIRNPTAVNLVFPDTGGHVSTLCLVTETEARTQPGQPSVLSR